MATIKQMRNDATGELAPIHVIGTDAGGRRLVAAPEGWSPADSEGVEIDPKNLKCDRDGNFIG